MNIFDEFEVCLKLMLSRKDASERMAIAGKSNVEKNYSWDTIQRRYFEIVQKQLEKQNNNKKTKLMGVYENMD